MPDWKFLREQNPETRKIALGEDLVIGKEKQTVMIAGPCSIESWEQINEVAKCLIDNDIKILRAGCYKPRTSPYSFKGLEEEGLKMLAEIREKYGLKIITEVKDSTQVQTVLEYADIVQIGAKAMWDYGILAQLGETNKPTLIKRSFAATTQEACQIGEYLLNSGNDNIMICERGIRTFEPNSRFTLDLCGSAWIKKHTNIPVVLDPSHAMGFSYGVPELALASMATSPSAIMIEVHPNPSIAKSDAAQQLNLGQFSDLMKKLRAVGEAVGNEVV